MDRFDRRFFGRLWSLTRPFWCSEQRLRSAGMLALLLALVGGSIALRAIFSYIGRDFTNALVAKDATKFYRLLEYFLVWIMLMVPVEAYAPWLSDFLSLQWRIWLTDRFLEMWLSERQFYWIDALGLVDNPDQRISEDISLFTTESVSYVLQFASSTITGVIFFAILWSISERLALVLLGWAAAGTWLSAVVGKRLVGINFNQQRYEADFRFGLLRVRDNAESIALYRGERKEGAALNRRFAQVVRNFKLLIRWQRHLAFVTFSYNNSLLLLPNLLLAGAYFTGRIQIGEFTQAAIVFNALKESFSLVVAKFEGLTRYAAVVNRLTAFEQQCESAQTVQHDTAPRIDWSEGGGLQLQDLTLLTPDCKQALASGLCLKVEEGDWLLVNGPTGAGKTSLLRAIAGLCLSGHGTIVTPAVANVLFLPQRPYMILGTLRDQLCYPAAGDTPDEHLRGALQDVGLEDLPVRFGGFDVEQNWPGILSIGEQQRLAFARLLVNRPRYAFLDEATSALDPAGEEVLYRCLKGAATTVVSVSHHRALLKYHERVLELSGGGAWALSSGSMGAELTRKGVIA